MSIQYTVLGFEPTAFRTWVSSHISRQKLPSNLGFCCVNINFVSVKKQLWANEIWFQVKLDVMRDNGFTMTHFVCAVLTFVPNVLSKTIFFLIYRNFGPSLGVFYDLLSNEHTIILTKGSLRLWMPQIPWPVGLYLGLSDVIDSIIQILLCLLQNLQYWFIEWIYFMHNSYSRYESYINNFQRSLWALWYICIG